MYISKHKMSQANRTSTSTGTLSLHHILQPSHIAVVTNINDPRGQPGYVVPGGVANDGLDEMSQLFAVILSHIVTDYVLRNLVMYSRRGVLAIPSTTAKAVIQYLILYFMFTSVAKEPLVIGLLRTLAGRLFFRGMVRGRRNYIIDVEHLRHQLDDEEQRDRIYDGSFDGFYWYFVHATADTVLLVGMYLDILEIVG